MIYLHEVQSSVPACLAPLLLSGLFELLISPIVSRQKEAISAESRGSQ